ncbi:MAG: N-acetyltransferase [Methanobacterium sp.]|nr:N-acetyltransferase [Methanobacterium sp.]
MIKIRPEKDTDHKAIFNLTARAFGRDHEARLLELFRKDRIYERELSLVAERDGEILGHILFTRISIEPHQEKFHAVILGPLAVKPGLQKQGIGSKLIAEGIETCQAQGYHSIIVIGHPNYYPKFGFKSATDEGLKSPVPVPDEAFMVLELVPESLTGVKGEIKFPKEFFEIEGLL